MSDDKMKHEIAILHRMATCFSCDHSENWCLDCFRAEVQPLIRAAVEAEREACANICDDINNATDGCGYCDDDSAYRAGAAIRNRAKEPSE